MDSKRVPWKYCVVNSGSINAFHTCSSRGADEDLVDVGGSGHVRLLFCAPDSACVAQREQAGDERFGVTRDPAIVDLADRDGVEVVELGTARPFGDDQVRLLEHVQVLHDAEARHVGQHLAELVERLAVAAAQRVEQGASPFVGQRLEDLVHTSMICDCLVTYQERAPKFCSGSELGPGRVSDRGLTARDRSHRRCRGSRSSAGSRAAVALRWRPPSSSTSRRLPR